ncbi:uncharacterized protein LOC144110371 [Amblyomma americanum]
MATSLAAPEPAKHAASPAELKSRTGRTVRAAIPFSPDVRLPVRTKKKTARKEPNTCKKCDVPIRGASRLLCAACLQSSLDVGYKEAQNNQAFEEEKAKYLDDAKAFAASLANGYDDPNAERLYCPEFRPQRGPCACIQKYLTGDGSDQKVRSLLQLLQEAKKLSQQKCYNWEEVKRGGKSHAVGMGNGQKHSESFEQFVNEHRPRLRELKMCERATQKILFYSNNFLHRYLKTEPSKGRRVQRTKGKAALGKLRSLDELAEDRCCQQRCAGLARRYATLVSQWRERSQLGQTENRRVLAEMLTPSGPNSTNCYKFISWVTGCSYTTIAKVSKQMLATGGDREPPPHKLKKFWDSKNGTQEEEIAAQNEAL